MSARGAPGVRRPKREPIEAKVLVGLTHEQLLGLGALARRLGVTQSEVLRMALDALLDGSALVSGPKRR